jgi:hypothetical protein
MTRVYSAAKRDYLNITSGAGRLLLVLGGAYLVFRPKEVQATETVYKPYTENLEVTYHSPINTVGIKTKQVKDGDVIQGARDQIQVNYRVTGLDLGTATITYGDEEQVIESAEGLPVSFAISKPSVIKELDKNGYLQVQISVASASAQAEARTVSFRYEGA